jgi:hypothetical protein
VGDVVYHLVADDTLALPRGVPHAHIITSPNARVLTIAVRPASSNSFSI